MRESKSTRFLSVILTLACLLGLLVVPALPARAAAEGAPAWAVEAYEILEAHGITIHVTSSTPIERQDFATELVMLLDVMVSKEELAAYPAPEKGYFADSISEMVYRAAGYGIVEGSFGSDGRRYLNGSDHLTREQAAKMLVALLDFFSQKLGHTVKISGSPAVYRDAASISAWALPYTQTVAAYGLMKGDDQANFNPLAELDWPSAAVMLSRTLVLMDEALNAGQDLLPLQSKANLLGISRFGAMDIAMAKPWTGWARGYYTIDNGDGTVSLLTVVDPNSVTMSVQDENGNWTRPAQGITVETFAADGSLRSTKTLELELTYFGAFYDSGEHFYLAFGNLNRDHDDSKEVIRVVQYDRQWNRLGSVSVYGKESYTAEPFRSTVSRMAVSGDGDTVTLYTARTRYDGHQSNITISMDVKPFRIQKVMREPFPSNHVSHSFGQFVRYDGNTMVTVDHGDAYPPYASLA